MKKRWFQFSLRAAIVMMLLAGVGIGVYIRLPYYRAAKALDEAAGDATFDGWPAVRQALIYNRGFRDAALERPNGFRIVMLHRATIYLGQRSEQIHVSVSNDTLEWIVCADEMNGDWQVSRLYTTNAAQRTANAGDWSQPASPAAAMPSCHLTHSPGPTGDLYYRKTKLAMVYKIRCRCATPTVLNR